MINVDYQPSEHSVPVSVQDNDDDAYQYTVDDLLSFQAYDDKVRETAEEVRAEMDIDE